MDWAVTADGAIRSRGSLGAVLLAAGAGSRMGHRPKSLLELNGVPLIRLQLRALTEAGIDTIVVVLGHYADLIGQAIQDYPVILVRNPDPDAGQISSLRIGLKALPLSLQEVLVALADQPLINAQDLTDLMLAYNSRPAQIHVVQPTVNGLPGNPVMFSNKVREEILAAPAQVGCRQWQAAHPEQVQAWVTHNPHYRSDVDTPDDIHALVAQTGHSLQWSTNLVSV
jgi:molybdenum cofactor cytidylyltransferase